MSVKQGAIALARPLLREARSSRCACHRRYIHLKEHSVIDTISGVEANTETSFRRHEHRPPPHLPLPPTLPYHPTSTPFRRHLQVLEESLLSSFPEPSWEIFTAIHEDLRRRHVPANTLRSVLTKQVSGLTDTGRNQTERWQKVNEVLIIMEESGICPKSEDLENVIVAAVDDRGRRAASRHFTHGRLAAVWASLAAIHGDRLQNVGLETRKRWLLYRMRKSSFEPRHTCGTRKEKFSKMRYEWQCLASNGFFKGFKISEMYLQGFRAEYLEHIEEILETLRTIHENGGIIPLDVLQHVWHNHLEARIRIFEPPDPQLHQFMDDISSSEQTASGTFDAALGESLAKATADLTGGVSVTALSLYLPSDKMQKYDLDRISSNNFERALNLTQRRLKHIPRQPAGSQFSSIVNTLGFAALLVEDAVSKEIAISKSFVLAICRAFKYLPTEIREDPRYIQRLHSALLLLWQSLRQQDNSLKRWTNVWPAMLETISSYATGSGKRDLLSQTMFVYRRLQSQQDPAHLETLSVFRKSAVRTTLITPWISLELYADAIASGCAENPEVRELIVQRISTMNSPNSFRRLRSSIARDQSVFKTATKVSVIENAISTSRTAECALKLYDILDATELVRGNTATKALGLLLERTVQSSDMEQRQQAVSKVEEAYSRGQRLPSAVLEKFLKVVVGRQIGETAMPSRLKALEAALIEGKRIYVS